MKSSLKKLTLSSLLVAVSSNGWAVAEDTQVYWGDTHLHTSLSLDAFLHGNQSADPDTAYRWAKGQPVIHPYNRARVQIKKSLDFLVVSDHSEIIGVMRAIANEEEELGELGWLASLKRWVSLHIIRNAVEEGSGSDIHNQILPYTAKVPGSDPVKDPANFPPDSVLGDTSINEINSWNETINAAERHNEPGKFTAFIGWEWSSIPTGANLHRVVITPDGAEKARQYQPFGADDSMYPEDLWAWLDDTSKKTGSEFIAIPHNSNISKGYMFAETTLHGQPITVDYARTRMAWEPLVEITQIKGDSETHPELSPDDEFADFESYEHYIQQEPGTYKASKADFVRSGLRRGLEIEKKLGVNPYKFGVIGSTDSHTGISSAEENNFWGKYAPDSTPETKQGGMLGGNKASGWDMSAAGLAAVWAQNNTREDIYAAFKRREVYASTGPRMQVRMFGGWGFERGAEYSQDLAKIGYAQGVPMGGDLIRPGGANEKIEFLIHAVKEPGGANLDRVQVVKGWLDVAGNSHEKVFNVAWSDDRKIDAQGKLPTVGDTVNRTNASYLNSIGASELVTVWQDPEFNVNQRAFYYVRVLQIPTPRHSLYDAVALQIEPPVDEPWVIQERAYTSAIWYTP